jgi:hypothetical protein
MRVRFNHGSAQWPTFTAFHQFRRRLAREAAIDLDTMEGFGGLRAWKEVTDRIAPLLEMADVDGSIGVGECGPVAKRLRELVRTWPAEDLEAAEALRLADGLDEAGRLRQRFRVVGLSR